MWWQLTPITSTRCSWCGRHGTNYLHDDVPLCDNGGIDDKGCLWGGRKRDQMMSDALGGIFCLRNIVDDTSIIDAKRHTLTLIVDNLSTFLGGRPWHVGHTHDVADRFAFATPLDDADAV